MLITCHRSLYSPVSGCIGIRRIGGEELRLAKASWDGGVFDATELLYEEVRRR